MESLSYLYKILQSLGSGRVTNIVRPPATRGKMPPNNCNSSRAAALAIQRLPLQWAGEFAYVFGFSAYSFHNSSTDFPVTSFQVLSL